MNKEVPRSVWVTLAILGVIGLGYGIWQFGFAGPGSMSDEDRQRAEMQAQAGNQRMQGYIPQGTPGAPPSSANKPAEMLAREKAGGKY